MHIGSETGSYPFSFSSIPDDVWKVIIHKMDWKTGDIVRLAKVGKQFRKIVYASPLYQILKNIQALPINFSAPIDLSPTYTGVSALPASFCDKLSTVEFPHYRGFQRLLLSSNCYDQITSVLKMLTHVLPWYPEIINKRSQNPKLKVYASQVVEMMKLVDKFPFLSEEEVKQVLLLTQLKTVKCFQDKEIIDYSSVFQAKSTQWKNWPSVHLKPLLLFCLDLWSKEKEVLIKDFVLCDALLKDKEVIEKWVALDIYAFKVASSYLQLDRSFVLKLLAINGSVLKFAQELQGDTEAAQIACLQDISVLEHVSESLREDPDFFSKLLPLLCQSMKALIFGYLGAKLKRDRNFFLKVLPICGKAIFQADRDLKNDRDLVLIAIKQDASVFEKLYDKYKHDIEIFEIAFERDRETYVRAPLEIKNQTHYALSYLQRGGSIHYVPQNFYDNEEIMLTAVKVRGAALMLAGSRCLLNLEIAHAAIAQDPFSLQYVSSTLLKEHPDLVWEPLERNPKAIQFVPEDFDFQKG